MPTREELLLEAKKRGLLPPEMVTALDEIERRKEGGNILNPFAQGATLGWGDEIGAAAAATVGKVLPESVGGLPSGHSWTDAYEGIRDNIRADTEAYAERNPKTALAAEIGGGLVTGGMGAKRTLGKELATGGKRLADLMKVGGATGAVAGAGYGEGAEGTATGTVTGGVIGAGLAPVVPAIGSVMKRSWGGARKLFPAIGGRTAPQHQVADDLQRAGFTTADKVKQELSRMGPEATLADISPQTKLRANTLANMPGGGNTAAKYYVDRNAKAGRRMSQYIDGLMSGRLKPADAVEDLIKTVDDEAAPLFKKAYQKFSNLSPFRSVSKVVDGKSVTSLEVNPAQRRLANMYKAGMVKDAVKLVQRDRVKAGSPKFSLDNMGLREWHEVRKKLDQIGYGKVKETVMGKPLGDASIARRLRKKLDDELARITTEKDGTSVFKAADNIYSGSARLKNAYETGQKAWRMRPEQIKRALNEMSEGEREAFRISAIDEVRYRAADTSFGGNVRARILRSANDEDRLKAIFPKDQIDDLIKKVDIESEFNDTYKQLTQNSSTALRQAAGRESAVDPAALVTSIAQPKSVLPQLWNRVSNAAQRPTMNQRDELARLLMDPSKAMQSADMVYQRNPVVDRRLQQLAQLLAIGEGEMSGAMVNR